jgi:inner membrane protein
MFLAFMSITHALIAAAGTSLILATADPMALGLAVLASQLPDIDTTTSTIGKIFFPLSSFIEDRFPHRSITHSLLATGLIAAVSLPIGYFLGNWLTAIAQQEAIASPRRLTVTVKVQEPQDLKVQEGSVVKKGQVIAARDRVVSGNRDIPV